MDPELIAYLDARFGGIDERFRGIDERFRETHQQIQGLREETAQQFQALHEELRLTNVRVEKLADNDRQLAEGIAAVDEKLAAVRDTAALEFSGIRSDLKTYYRDLDRRVKVLERRAQS